MKQKVRGKIEQGMRDSGFDKETRLPNTDVVNHDNLRPDKEKKAPLLRGLDGGFARLSGLFFIDMGIDVGSANTRVFVKDRGIVLNEPSIVAVQAGTNHVLAVGDEAKRMQGRAPAIILALSPLLGGVIRDFEAMEAMLRYSIKRGCDGRRMVRPRVIIAVPSGIAEVEKCLVKESALNAGARTVLLIEKSMAAAIGSGLRIHESAGSMIVDIGGGATEMAVISLAGIVYSRSIRVGGEEMDYAIIQHIKREHALIVGDAAAEEIKIKIGSAVAMAKEKKMEVSGLDLVEGGTRMLTITSEEIRKALKEPVDAIISAVRDALEKCPPDFSRDLVDRGLVLSGGGALLRGLDKLISRETIMKVQLADEPLNAVVGGTGIMLHESPFRIEKG